MAVLAAYLLTDRKLALADYLEKQVFADPQSTTIAPNEDGVKGFDDFIERYQQGLSIVQAAKILPDDRKN